MTTLREALQVIDRANMHYRVEFKHDEIADVAKAICQPASAIHGLIAEVTGIMPKSTLGNQHDPDSQPYYVHTFEIGREFSRVLYVQVIKTYFLSKPDSQWETLRRGLKSIGEKYHVDENDVEEESPTSLTWRFWWD